MATAEAEVEVEWMVKAEQHTGLALRLRLSLESVHDIFSLRVAFVGSSLSLSVCLSTGSQSTRGINNNNNNAAVRASVCEEVTTWLS